MKQRTAEPTDDMVQCPACQGQGVIKRWHGDHSPERDCLFCRGVGGVTEDRFHAYHDGTRL